MYLDFLPAPSFCSCSTKIFRQGEDHVTRRFQKSVLILMLENELRFGEDGKEIRVRAGEYYIQREGLFQEGLPMEIPPTYFYIEFFGHYSEETGGLPLRGTFSLGGIASLLQRFETLYRQSHTDFFKLNSYFCRVLSELSDRQPSNSEKQKFAYRIRSLLESDYYRPLPMAELSARFGYDKDYLAQIFRECYDVSPHRYLTELRMEHARWMLENTAMSAEQIAFSVGYAEFSAFWRNFKKTYGRSPAAMRKQRE